MFNYYKVRAYTKVLVFKNGRLINVLSEGVHWLPFMSRIEVYKVDQEFRPNIDLNLLAKNSILNGQLDIINVQDEEIVVQFKNGNFDRVLTKGSYAFWKDGIVYSYERVDLTQLKVDKIAQRKLMNISAINSFIKTVIVESYEKAMLFVDGEKVENLNSGVHKYWISNKIITVRKIDIRNQLVQLSGQELLTKDKANIRVNFNAKYKVVDFEKALESNNDANTQWYIMLQLALREFIGTKSLDDLLANKDSCSEFVEQYLLKNADELGYELISCGIKDIILPGEIKDIMNQVLMAEKKAQANIIMRREETASTRSLLNTAKLMEDNAMLFKLKEMEYVEKIAENVQNISLAGNGQLIEQLKDMFTAK